MTCEQILTLATTGALLILFIQSGQAFSFPSSGDLRLAGSSNGSTAQGRVEIFHNGSWGTVCDDSWDMNEGNVVCKQLGFTGAIAVYSQASFGKGTGRIWMDDLYCRGNESRLENCQHNGWGVSNCDHSEDAGVACKNVTIQRSGSCSFETGSNLCGYKNLRSDDLDWSLSASGYSWWSYLPRHDHTTGNGHYIYVRGRYHYAGKKAQLMSPVLNGVQCLHFYYFMKGSRVGQLNVYLKTVSNRTLLWQNVGPQSAVWIKAIVPIKWASTPFTIMFEAVIGGSYGADVAIDDIEVFDKPCVYNHTGNCTFESGHKCGYTQPSDNTVKWVLHHGRIDWRSFGPRQDHLGSVSGYFVYFKTTYSTTRGQKSQLISPEIYGGRCVQFYYYMGGSAPGELNVYIDDGVKRSHVWELIGPQSNKWLKGELPIGKVAGAFKVVFEALAGSYYNGRIALDDILILSKNCKVFPSSASVTPIDIRNISKEVRLVGSNSTSAGRIEVFYNGKWGTICGSNFPLTSGRVVCRQLGFSDAVMVVPCCSVFGSGKGRILLQDVKCRGQESDIKMCSHRQWGMTTCYHSQDVGVICKSNHTGKDVRLNGTAHNYKGAAEVNIGGVWGTISDSGWDIYDADVFCRQAGFSGASEALSYAHQRGSHGPEWISNTYCSGDETSFWNCNYTIGIQQRYWWYYRRQAGAKCYDLKLFGGKTENEGIVLIRWEGTWGTICNDGWDIKDAQVVCRNLGYSKAKSIKVSYNVSAPKKTTSLLSQFECQGDEASLATCSRRSLASVSHTCTHDNDAIVVCDSQRITPSPSTKTTTPRKPPASTPKTSPTTTTKPAVCKQSKKYGKVCNCGKTKEGNIWSHSCYVLGKDASSVSLKVNETQWNAKRFKDMLAKQLTKFCGSNSCGQSSPHEDVFTASDIVIITTGWTAPQQTHVLFVAFDSHTKKPLPSDVIRAMINHDKTLAGLKVFHQSPTPHPRVSGKKHPNVIMMVGIALGALLFGAVMIFAIVYRKRKRRLRALVRYRVPDCPPELNLSDDEDETKEDDRLLTLNENDQAPLLPSTVVA